MELTVVVPGQTATHKITVANEVFGKDFNEALIHQVVLSYLSNARASTKGAKTRGEVSGGGRKPWAQKHTGRARVGSIRSPLWRGGGKVFAAHVCNYEQKINKKMYRGAMRSILSELIRQGRFFVVESLTVEKPETSSLKKMLKELNLSSSVLIVTDDLNENLYLSARNLSKINVRDVEGLDPVSLIKFDQVLMTVNAVKQIEEWLK
jgi:large subunit ribosomal protein L4